VTDVYEATTTIRRPRTALMWGLVGALVVAGVLMGVFRNTHPLLRGLGPLPLYLAGPLLAAVGRRLKVEQSRVVASAEGVRLNDTFVPRAKLKSALLRHESGKSWVLLRGVQGLSGNNVDVEVKSDEEADRLCAALGLDAKSTTAEFLLFRPMFETQGLFPLLFVAMTFLAATGIVLGHALFPVLMLAAVLLLAAALPLLTLLRRVKLVAGADGIVLKQGLSKPRFIPHASLAGASADGQSVKLAMTDGSVVVANVGP
jgi:hypothetical protein